MKIKVDSEILKLDGSPLLVEQKVEILDGVQQVVGGHPLTVGEGIANILSLRKVSQFNPLKANALAEGFFNASVFKDIDEGDLSLLMAVLNETEIYNPRVIGQLLRACEAAKGDAEEKPGKADKRKRH